MTPAEPRPGRNLGFDLLRAFAISLVLVRHCPPPPEHSFPVIQRLLEVLGRGGWVGVDVFFVLSGFLVSGLLFSEFKRRGDVSIGRFLIRRGLKIYPAFWVATVGSVFVILFVEKAQISRRMIVGDVFFLQNYLGSLTPATWSLAVEEHFYALLAAWVAWEFRIHRRAVTVPSDPFARLPKLFIVVASICFLLRLGVWAWVAEFSYYTFLFGSHLRLDSLLFGVLLAYWVEFRLRPETAERLGGWRWAMVGIGLACLVPAFIFDVEVYRWVPFLGVMLFTFGAGLLVLAAALHPLTHNPPLVRWVAFAGARSYSVYLWHGNVLKLALALAPLFARKTTAWLVISLSYLAASWLVGLLMAHLVEFPVLRLRDRWFKTRAAPDRATAAGP